MVLQRDRLNRIWGWTVPGQAVRIDIDGVRTDGNADENGKWMVEFDPPAVGGPYNLTIHGEFSVELTDVMVGDVWLCSGQSNMEMGLSLVENAEEEISAADYPLIRLYTVPKLVAYEPVAVNPARWKVCSPETVCEGEWAGFSAVAYFYGRELASELKIPIGLLSSSWGGTAAEVWVSETGLTSLCEFSREQAVVADAKSVGDSVKNSHLDLWLGKYDLGSIGGANWHCPNCVDIPWRETNLTTLDDKVGTVSWLQTEIEFPQVMPAGPVTLELGRVDGLDWAFWDGREFGNCMDPAYHRSYVVPSDLTTPGHHFLTVRVVLPPGSLGFSSWNGVALGFDDGTKLPISDGWRIAEGANLTEVPPLPKELHPWPDLPSVLFNGMIAPLVPMALRGAIWYQGESNTARAFQYRTLLPTLIQDWRKWFGQGDFPFYIVSLASFMPQKDLPGDDDWAELREAQAMTAETIGNSGIAITIDVGDALDVHPKNKKTVGQRLAFIALANEYGLDIPYAGPTFSSLEINDGSLVLNFTHVGNSLVARADKLAGFAVAGDDRRWAWADATISGHTVIVKSNTVPFPVAARYGWAINPVVSLFNDAGLPAGPFRTDDWPLSTQMEE